MLRDTNQVDWKRIECGTHHQAPPNLIFRCFGSESFDLAPLRLADRLAAGWLLLLQTGRGAKSKHYEPTIKNEVLVRGATLNSLAIDLVGVPKHARTQLGRYRRV